MLFETVRKSCPKLRELDLSAKNSLYLTQGDNKLELELSAQSGVTPFIMDELLAICLDSSVKGWTSLDVSSLPCVGPRSIEVLFRHTKTLRSLYFPNTAALSSEQWQSFMSRCPALQIFKVQDLCHEQPQYPEIHFLPKDFNPKNWPCQGILQEFNFKMYGVHHTTDRERDQHRELFQRLSTLVALKKLSHHYLTDVSSETSWYAYRHLDEMSGQGLGYWLGMGLEELSTLTQLEDLDIRGTVEDPSEDDLLWMRKTWPQLKIMRKLTISYAVSDSLKSWMSANWRNVDVVEYKTS